MDQPLPFQHLKPGEISPELIAKLDRSGPRYTSYPTAPEWTESFGPTEYAQALQRADEQTDPLAIYVHIPFCAELCFFCGCTVVVTNNPAANTRYLDRLRAELALVTPHLRRRRTAGQLHFGGGTPTHLTPAELEELHGLLSEHFQFTADAEKAIEVDPRVTTPEHVAALRKLGFNRISLGVQDFDPTVQNAVNRQQSEEKTRELFELCRRSGFTSINIDLIYGLPYQTPESFAKTLSSVIAMRPDRVAVFGYAHVPWMKKAQTKFERKDRLPTAAERCALFSSAVDAFTGAGYRSIGLDHFALPHDELTRALENGTMTRSFQGYTTRPSEDLVSFGHSAISDLAGAYAQNGRELPTYEAAIREGRLATCRGYRLTHDDELRRSVIMQVMSGVPLRFAEVERRFGVSFTQTFAREIEELKPLESDGLLRLESDRLTITPIGRIFVRNVAMTFDRFLREKRVERKFSRTV